MPLPRSSGPPASPARAALLAALAAAVPSLLLVAGIAARLRAGGAAGADAWALLALSGLLPVVLAAATGWWAGAARVTAWAVGRAASGDAAAQRPAVEGGPARTAARAVAKMREEMEARLSNLSEQTRLNAAILASMHEGILVVDGHLAVQAWNEALVRLLRPPVGDLRGRPLVQAVRHDEVLDAFSRVLAGSPREDRKFRTRAPDPRHLELRVVPLAGRDGAAGVFLDVTRLELLENIRQSFIANVSHELRTPLSSIKAFTETLLDGGIEDAEHRLEFLGIIARHADRMQALIDDLTDLSMIESGDVRLEPEELDLGDLARLVVAEISPRAREREIEVRVAAPPGLRVRADRHRMEQVLVNLLDNAVKFNRPRGSVEVLGIREGMEVTVRVEDTGPGIPPQDLDRIFHRFYRVDTARSRELGGTGLGLSIVKHLVRIQGGTVHAENLPAGGAALILRFPAAAGAPPP